MMRSPQPELANDCALRNGRKSRIGICRLDTPVQAGSHPWCRPTPGDPVGVGAGGLEPPGSALDASDMSK